MSLYRPKTTLRLILYGFTFVGLPLILALVYSAVYVGRLSTQSQTAVYKAALAAQGSRQLLDQLTSMERNARQYLILKDPTLMDAYTSNHKQFQATASQLLSLPLDQKHGERVAGLARSGGGGLRIGAERQAGRHALPGRSRQALRRICVPWRRTCSRAATA